MTARNAATGVSRDVEVSAEPDTTVASVLDALPLPAGGQHCYVGERWLDPSLTIARSPLAQGAVISIGVPGPDPRALAPGVVGALRVVDGHDAGLVAWLAPGRRALGRAPDADVTLLCEEASRQHAELDVDLAGRVLVTDAGSHNGTFVDGAALAALDGPAELPPGAVLEIGSDRLEWEPLAAHHPLVATPAGDGRLDFDRAFVSRPAIARAEVTLPAPTVRPPTSKIGIWLSALLPVVMGVVLAFAMQRPLLLLMCLLGPLSIMGNQVGDRRQRRLDRERYEQAKAAVLLDLGERIFTEERARRAQAPDRVSLAMAATGASREVWARGADSPDGMLLRVGLTDAPASLDLRGERWPDFAEPTLRRVPLTVDLRAAGVLGVAGPTGPRRALARWLLVQLGVLRGPDDLRIVLLTSSDDADLSWASWLPHTTAGDGSDVACWVGNTESTRAERVRELRELVSLRLAQRRGERVVRFEEDVVVLLDGALALRNLPGMKAVLRDGPEAGVYVLAVDEHGMTECRAQCVVDDHLALQVTRGRGEQVVRGSAEGIDTGEAEMFARAVAPLRDRLTLGSSDVSIPHPVRFLDLLGVRRPTARDVADLWAASPGPTTRVVLGADADGPVTVDLAAQGPHTMLAGATGTGKSILLQTLVTSLLLANSPDELNLVLVDFKGGSAFLPFERCPHVVALIRSTGQTAADVFDEAAARRVLASVRAEVNRRERLLARYGGEIDEYWRAGQARGGGAPLPRLVMVFDEFARVLETSPDFLKELVNVAAKGRSLGMHLVLATQSLQGKLTAELKNNIDLRITLRQNEPADSVEVLGVPDAASIPGRLRGRGMILCTKDETRTPRLFQSGYLGDPPPAGGARAARVRLVGWSTLGLPRPDEKIDHGGAATDQTLTIWAIEEAADLAARPAPFRPLLPPLPADLTLAGLATAATAPPRPSEIPFGLVDDPAAQAQPPAVFDLDGTERLLVAGGPQTGRTTLARALVTSLATRFRPDQAHVYVIERTPAGLAEYAALPHCGAVVAAGEPDRVRRLVTWLGEEVAARQASRLGGAGGAGGRRPRLVLVVDGWDHFENRDPAFVETSLLTTLREVISSGPPVGVHVVALGGQDLAGGRTATLFTRRVLLPFGKEELRRLHLPSGAVSPPELPGRAADAATGAHLQIARPHLTAAELAVLVTSGPDAHAKTRADDFANSRVGGQAGDLAEGRAGWRPDVPAHGRPGGWAGDSDDVRLGGTADSPAGAHADHARAGSEAPTYADPEVLAHTGAHAGTHAASVDIGTGGTGAGTDAVAAGVPRAFPSLPTTVRGDELALPDPRPSGTWLPLGIGGRDVAVVGLDPFDAGPHALLVSGPPGSGRSTAAAALARGLRRLGVGVLLVAPPRSPLAALAGAGAGARGGGGGGAGGGAGAADPGVRGG
ncbi:FtsK/SpoIIIE domain-containing protein, partial [Frankia nepalensis]|uniref:FtsK/SpoIIIE domain-containing protein n=1 Tax=Frankia nepalensis TaxID=1836974 RepID=UPI001EE4DBB0